MAKNVEGLIVEQDIVAQEFNLEDLLGVDLSSDPTLAAEIGQDIIEFIKKRADKNQGIGGKALRKPYSKMYQNSFEFKQYGKTANDVNMRLTGDMLDSIQVLDFDGSTLVVGIEGEQAPKAHGHMTGKNGEVPKMKREFFGLTSTELDGIIKNYSDRIDKMQEVESLKVTPAEEEAINRFFKSGKDLFEFEGFDGES